MKSKIENLIATQRVVNVLKNEPATRDNDSLLYICLLQTQYGCSRLMRDVTVEDKVREGELPSRDFVTRVRRRLQKRDETLRGELWEIRQKYAKKYAKEVNSL